MIWGRCVFDAIRMFLQFQLSVNISAVVLTIVTAMFATVTGLNKPVGVLTAIQLLWLNLIMNSFAALAFANEKPHDGMLNRKPLKRSEAIINPTMTNMILGQAFYQVMICMMIYFYGPYWLKNDTFGYSIKEIPPQGFTTATLVFNVYIFCQIFNQINCRSITKDFNIFKGLRENPVFIGVFIFSITIQALFVQFGGVVVGLAPGGLTLEQWGWSILFGSGSLLIGVVVRLLPDTFYVSSKSKKKTLPKPLAIVQI